MKFALLSFILLLPGHISAQDAIPGFDIFLARIAEPQAQPVNITATPGYENQPAFSPDGSQLYFTRMQADEQTDIWAYSLVQKELNLIVASEDAILQEA